MTFLITLVKGVLIGLIIFLLILTLYLVANKTNEVKMHKIYDFGSMFSDDNAFQKTTKNMIEKYIGFVLSVPDFSFASPIYFDASGEKTEMDYTGNIANIATTIEAAPPITFEDMKIELYKDLSTDKVFMGMSSDSVKNLGAAVGIMILSSLVEQQGKVFLKKAITKGTSKTLIKIAKALGVKATAKTAVAVSKTVAKTELKILGRALRVMISKFGVKYTIKAGLLSAKSLILKGFGKLFAKSATKAATTMGAKAGVKLATTIATKGAILAAKASAKMGMGPVGWALLAFDVISFGLDVGDGGGYNKLDETKEARDQTNKELNAKYKEMGYAYPNTIGPISKYVSDDNIDYVDKVKTEQINIIKANPTYETRLIEYLEPEYETDDLKYEDILLKLSDEENKTLEGEAIKAMCDRYGGTMNSDGTCSYENSFAKTLNAKMSLALAPEGKYMKPFLDALNKWLADNPNATESQISEITDVLQNQYLGENTMKIINDEIMKNWCISEGGKVLMDGKTCSYATVDSCLKYYYGDDGKPQREYTMWDETTNKCVEADVTTKRACEEYNLKYNSNNGLCEMTEKYCITKGVEWDAANKNCVIPVGQEILEFIFGTTVVRGLKQTFDVNQYEKCKPGTTDIGYACSRDSTMPNCSLHGNAWENNGTQCTNQGTVKIPTCTKGFENTIGAGICNPYRYGRGAGAPFDSVYYTTCPGGWRNDGVTCWWSEYHSKPWDWVIKKIHSQPVGWARKDDVSYSASPGNQIPDPGSNAKRSWNQVGALFYPACPEGLTAESALYCKTPGVGYLSCASHGEDWFLDGIRCVQGIKNDNGTYSKPKTNFLDYKCPPGSAPYLGKCRATCDSGWRDDGIVCWKPRSIKYSTKNN